MSRTRRAVPWPYFGLGVLAVVTLALVTLALRDPQPPAATVTVQPKATAVTDSATPTPGSDGMPEATATPAPDRAQGREEPLSVLSARSAVRASGGSCLEGGAQIEVTDDQGRTWEPVSTPADQVLRVNRPSGDTLWFVGGEGGECSLGFTSSEDRGETWVGPSDTTGAWHLELDLEARTLHAPYSTVDSPCADTPTVEVEAISFDEAWVLCRDGEVFGTLNAGVSWTSAGRADQAVALGVLGEVPVVAVLSSGDCTGLAVGEPGAAALGCVDGATSGQVGLGFAGPSAGFLVADGATWTSNDGGTTWTRRQ